MFDKIAFYSFAFLMYATAIYYLIRLWKGNKRHFYLFLTAILYGFIIEYIGVTHEPQKYFYTPAIVPLPGMVPFYICLGWGIIFISILETTLAFTKSQFVSMLYSGLLAVTFDLVLDPCSVVSMFWTWTDKGIWFGIPLLNFSGWFFVIISLIASYTYMDRRFFENKNSHLHSLLFTFFTIVPAVIGYLITITLYELAVTPKGELIMKGIPVKGLGLISELHLVLILLGTLLIFLAFHSRHFILNNRLNPVPLVVPVIFLPWCVVILFRDRFRAGEIVILLVVAAITAVVYFLPYKDKLLGKKG